MKMQVPDTNATEARRQTERIVRSQIFTKAKRSQTLLRYLVDATLADPPQVVKEYTIATEVFDRDNSYDPAIDATVRVEAGRLRSRLREYYADEGREDTMLIELPRGGYRVVLTERGDSPGPSLEVASSSVGADMDPAAGAGFSAPGLVEKPHGLARQWTTSVRTWRYAVPGMILGLMLIGYAGWRLPRVQRPPSGIRSVAVLPLKNLSGDPAQDYFADGTTDELITELARVPELRVVSWNSALQEKDTKKSLKTIAGELRADLLVEGSVSRSGDTVRINAQLIDTKNDDHLWANSFEGPLSDAMALENKVAEQIVIHAQAGARVVPQRGPAAGSPARTLTVTDLAAHDAYLRGRNYFDKRQSQASAEQFQRAIDLSPGYAPAYAGLAVALQSEALMGEARPEQIIPRAMAAVEKALRLDPNNGDALIARGSIETTFLWTWDAAERDLTRGIALSPNNTYGRMMLSVYLDSVGRPEDAVRQMQQAVEIDPLSFYMARHYGSTLFYARRYDEALRQLEYAREMYPAGAAVVDHWISDVYAQKGQYDEAVRYDLLGLQERYSNQKTRKLLAVYRQKGWRAYWEARFHELHGDDTDPLYSFEVGFLAARAGHLDQAIAALQHATDEHCYWMGTAGVNPDMDALRGHPGFAALLAGLHLPPSARP